MLFEFLRFIASIALQMKKKMWFFIPQEKIIVFDIVLCHDIEKTK